MDSMLCNWHQYVETEYFTFRVQLRREKISERMKLLQDLVPGCSKVSFFLSEERIVSLSI